MLFTPYDRSAREADTEARVTLTPAEMDRIRADAYRVTAALLSAKSHTGHGGL